MGRSLGFVGKDRIFAREPLEVVEDLPARW
jgi:hypothetical protein